MAKKKSKNYTQISQDFVKNQLSILNIFNSIKPSDVEHTAESTPDLKDFIHNIVPTAGKMDKSAVRAALAIAFIIGQKYMLQTVLLNEMLKSCEEEPC